MDPSLVEAWIADLSSPDEEVRRLAVERASMLADEDVRDHLLERLGDESWRVRKAACERIAHLEEPGATASVLLRALADGENPGRRNAALEVLRRIGSAALPALIGASEDPDVDVRKQVVDALAGIDDPEAIARLEQLLTDPDANVRGAAADALGSCGSEGSARVLREVQSQDDEGLVRLSALRALSRLGAEVPLNELKAALADSGLRPAAISLLAESDDPEAEERLVDSLHTARSAREAAMAALVRRMGRLESEAAAALEARIQSAVAEGPAVLEDALDRLGAAPLPKRLVFVQFLCLLKRRDVVAPLLCAGLDPALQTLVLEGLSGFGVEIEEAIAEVWDGLPLAARELALRLLGSCDGETGGDVLLQALEGSSLELRVEAAKALGRRREARFVPALVAAVARSAEEFEDADDEAIESLSDALVQAARSDASAARQAVALLSELPSDSGECHRITVARTLGELGGSPESGTLSLLLSDPSARVRRAAVHAIGRLADGASADGLRMAVTDEDPAVRIGAAGALVVARSPEALEALATLALDEEPLVRAAAVRAVAGVSPSHGEERILGILESALSDEGTVALASLEALSRIGGDAAADLAARWVDASDPDVASLAIACAGRHGGDAVLDRIVGAIEHDAWSVRAAAVQVVSERGHARAVPALLRRLEVEQDDFVRSNLLEAVRRLEP